MKEEVADKIRSIFLTPDQEEAKRLLKKTVDEYAKRAPALSEWLSNNLEEGLTVFNYPKSHQKRLRTTNVLERFNREIKRRTRVATLFPNTASCLRLVTAIAMEQSEDWETGRVDLKPVASRE